MVVQGKSRKQIWTETEEAFPAPIKNYRLFSLWPAFMETTRGLSTKCHRNGFTAYLPK